MARAVVIIGAHLGTPLAMRRSTLPRPHRILRLLARWCGCAPGRAIAPFVGRLLKGLAKARSHRAVGRRESLESPPWPRT